MDHYLQPVVGAMAGGSNEPVGWFSYQVATDSWTWSASLFQMHGFEPGEIVPTTEIFLSHKHPEDRGHTDAVLAAALATGQPFCCRHRIVTSRQLIRTVVTIGQGTLDGSGRVTEVRGYFVDITDASLHASREEVQEAVNRSAASRADIEQAKGALMVVQGLSADDAFAVLQWHSSHANMKLRDVARIITQSMSFAAYPDETPNQRIGRLLGAVMAGPLAVNGIDSTRPLVAGMPIC